MTDTAEPNPARASTAGGAEIVRTERMPWGASMVKHRHATAMRHKRLFDGQEGSPDNYSLAFADESSDYYSPSHRHLWDQVRFCAEGSVPIGRTMHVRAGEVAYFPEGVRYGPQEGGPDRRVLVLQFGGSSGHGYLSAEQIERARRELGEIGSFEGGLFRRRDGDTTGQQDAYEAIWEQATGVKAEYPEAIVEAPIVLRPPAFPAESVAGVSGVRRRRLGRFEPRGVTIDVLELDPDASSRLECHDGVLLGWITEGTGGLDGTWVEPHSAIRLTAGRTAELRADSELTLLTIRLPSLPA